MLEYIDQEDPISALRDIADWTSAASSFLSRARSVRQLYQACLNWRLPSSEKRQHHEHLLRGAWRWDPLKIEEFPADLLSPAC